MTNLDVYERSCCDCKVCQSACRSMPGSLAPEDIERIIDLKIQEGDLPDVFKIDIDSEWDEFNQALDTIKEFQMKHFAASEGSIVMYGGQLKQIPTIVPQQREDGSCMFLNDEGHCSIHKVSPYGCRNFTLCTEDEDEIQNQNIKSVALLREIMRSRDYMMHWSELQLNGSVARPLAERRQAYNREWMKAKNEMDGEINGEPGDSTGQS